MNWRRLFEKRPLDEPIPVDIQRDIRLDALYDEQTQREALEHFEALRREADERA